MTQSPQQLALPFEGAAPTKKKRQRKTKVLSPQQLQGLDRISASSSEYIVGIDEVGLGSWAGPIVVAAAVFPKGWAHEDVQDSKQLTHKKRMAALQEQVMPNAAAYCVLWATAAVVDAEGVAAVRDRLTESCALYCRQRYPQVLVVQDGDIPVEVDGSVRRVVWMPKADVHVPSVSAASILAKVSRDLYMQRMDETYPGYNFKSNVGYHSKRHVQGLEQLGVCPLHRMSYKPVKAYAAAHRSGAW